MNLPIVPLGDAVTFLDHLRRPITGKDRVPGPVPYFGANGQQDSVAGHLFDEPLVLLAEDGGFFNEPHKGVAYRITGRSWVNNHAHVLRPRENVDVGYLTRVLENYTLAPFVSGSTRGKLTKASAQRIPIPLPPLVEQRRIAAILNQADDLRTKRRVALNLLNEAEDAMFSELLRNRKNSGTASLGSYCFKITDGTHQSPAWTSAGVPFLFVSNIIGGTVNYLTSKYVSEETYLELTRNTPVEVGDVLYSAVGSYGVPALVTEDRRFIFQRHIAHIKPRHDRIDSSFLRAALSSPAVRRQADRVARGAAQKTVTLGELAKFEIPVVPLESQKAFANRLSKLTLLRSRGLEHLNQLDHLFSSLQHGAFSGEL